MADWDREKIKKVLNVLRELPDFNRVPLPREIHKEFDIPLNKPKNLNVMDYFERYMAIQKLPVDKVEVIDGSKLYKDVVFPTSILEPTTNPYEELRLDDGPKVIVHTEGETVFSTDTPIPSKEENSEIILPSTETDDLSKNSVLYSDKE